MLKIDQLRDLIIRPAILDLVMFSEDALELLVFTCCVESLGGTYVKQLNGPALGIYQMEPRTYNDIWQNYIKPRNDISLILISNFSCISMPEEDRLIYDLRFATVMARLHYARVTEKLPDRNDAEAMWEYYKKYYNTSLGSAGRITSLLKYHNYINR